MQVHERHDAESQALHQVVRESLATFYAAIEEGWVLSLPLALRAPLAYEPGLIRVVARVFADSLLRLRVFSGEEAVTAEPGVVLVASCPFGTVHVVQTLWRELSIDRVVAALQTKLGGRQPFERALFAMVPNWTSAPCSKLYCREQWLAEEVLLPGKEKLEIQHLHPTEQLSGRNERCVDRLS